jgi:hypothetical protein
LRPELPLPPLETEAAAYSDMAFQIWTSSVSSRSALPSACHGMRHLAQWTRTKMSGGRERERATPEQGRGAYLNMIEKLSDQFLGLIVMSHRFGEV